MNKENDKHLESEVIKEFINKETNWEKRFDKICEFTDGGVYVSYDKAVDFIRSERQKWEKEKLIIPKGKTHSEHDECEDCIYLGCEKERQNLRNKIKSKNINGVYLLDNQVEALLKILD